MKAKRVLAVTMAAMMIMSLTRVGIPGIRAEKKKRRLMSPLTRSKWGKTTRISKLI